MLMLGLIWFGLWVLLVSFRELLLLLVWACVLFRLLFDVWFVDCLRIDLVWFIAFCLLMLGGCGCCLWCLIVSCFDLVL